METQSGAMFVSGRYEPELKTAVGAALEAGRLLLDEFNQFGGPRGPKGHCPADQEAERLIRTALKDAFPKYGLIGEELSGLDQPPGDSEKHVWVIDPNDGTSGFQQGWRGAAVSIALLRAGVPVLGVVYAFAVGSGELFVWAEGQPFSVNGRTIPEERLKAETPPEVIFLSQSAEGKAKECAELCRPARFRTMPSIAYRLALVAAGRGAGAVSVNHPTSWDVAAGHALLRASGKELLTMDGRPVSYDNRGRGAVGNCVGGAVDYAARLTKKDWGSLVGLKPAQVKNYPLVRPDAGCIFRDAEILSRAQGALLGQIAGDNLGALVEFQDAAQIAAEYPDGPWRLVDGGHWNLLAGQPTDDSELALMLARSIVAAGGYDSEEAARGYAYWYKSGPFDIGLTTIKALGPALKALEANRGIAEAAFRAAGANLGSQANGALMRVSPLAVYGFSFDRKTLAELARRDAALTHAHQVCQDANAVYCLALAALVRGETDRESVYREVLSWGQAEGIEARVLEALRQAQDGPPADFQKSMGWVLLALQNAFFQLLHAPSLEHGVVATVRAGGDTDTNAAIAGALMGAYYGLEGLPGQWVDRVLTCRPIKGSGGCVRPRPMPLWPVDALHLAERLLWLGAKNSDRPDG